MNSFELCKDALDGKACERIPVSPEIDASYAAKISNVQVGECYLDEQLHAQVLNEVFAHHDTDGLYINLCLSKKQIASKKEVRNGWQVVDTFGDTWFVPFNDVASKTAYSIQSLDDPRLLRDNPLKEGIIETFRAMDPKLKREKMITPGLTSPFSQVVMMMGMQNVLYCMMDEPEKLKEIAAVRTSFAKAWADELIDLGAQFIWIGEGPASSSVISPRQYEEFVLPYEQELTAHIRSRGAQSVLHICGNINPSIENIAKSGAQGVDVDYLVNIDDAKKAFYNKCCIKGNLNPAELVRASEKEIYCKCRDIAGRFDENRGLILSTGCLVSRNTPKENIDAMIRACHEK